MDWNSNSRLPVPIAQLRAPDSVFLRNSGIQIIPVIFITNECIYKIDSLQAVSLAQKILTLANDIAANSGIQHVKEIQLDCDWTVATKGKYFSMLREIKRLSPGINLSVTIRLHQIKYSASTGIPPADRGMLMCYNMGNLTNIATRNSILDAEEMKKYILSLSQYPLHLDVAFPLFEWKVLFRNGGYAGLIENMPDSCLHLPGLFTKDGNRFTVGKDTTVAGYELQKNDLLRDEMLTAKEIMAAIPLISEKLPGNDIRVSLYHSDPLILKKYTSHEMENFYDGMR